MTIIKKWRLMKSSLADVRAAIIEKGGNINGGLTAYAKGVRSIYSSDEYAPKYNSPVGFFLKLDTCEKVKEEIRQAIIDGGVECDTDIPLSRYGDKIRQLGKFEVVTRGIDVGAYGDTCSITLVARGGTPPYTWKRSVGGCSGCELSSDGVFSGTVKSGSGIYKMFFTVSDSAGRIIRDSIWVTVHNCVLHFQNVGVSIFDYDGQPHSLDIICTTKPDLEFKVVYGAERTESVTERGQYLADIVVTGNAPNVSWVIDDNFRAILYIK